MNVDERIAVVERGCMYLGYKIGRPNRCGHWSVEDKWPRDWFG
jgi:hypothetical protein